jgi:MFS family permease
VRLPNWLATRRGRLFAFFALYLTEGIPLGFTATAIATQMRREGVSPAAIGAFVGSLYLPWSFKWAFGPFVDVLSSDRWGRRRMWIVGAQILMVAALLATYPVNFVTQLQLFTTIILIHNVFGATQDVAIDALAVNTLAQSERGLANGLMFSGAYLGQAIGGSGVLFLTPLIGFQPTFFMVAAAILTVTLLVAVPLREAPGPPRPVTSGSPLRSVTVQIAQFVRDALRAFTGTRAAFLAVAFAILPIGAYALGLALQSNLAVELGLDDARIGWLNLASTVISAGGCVLGGWLSDRVGRRRMLACFVVGMSLSTAVMAVGMHNFHWIMPVSPQALNRPVPPEGLIALFWTMVLVYAFFQGLMYGTSTALFMDITTPRVAATQFTAYMALFNFAISYSATWQGIAVERWGYPVTLTLDALFGVVSLSLLPWMSPARRAETQPAGAAIPELAPH